ncbi:MAG TPA: SurA N-terminal domain-containing protein [Alphaproteobacteria bacterium]|nr:SurA N-terminal domain-containing protein [Alphaproteobacteria bacterium]
MLQSMRSSAKSWVMVVLFGLLILSFAVWGIGDILRPGVSGTAALVTVGGTKITFDQFRRQLTRTIEVQRQRLGVTLTFRQAYQLGLANQVLQNMINEELLALGATDVGVAVSNELVAREIREDRSFRNRFDEFDRAIFTRALGQAQLTEAGYVEGRRREIARGQITGVIAANQTIPRSLVERLFRYQNEKRVADIIVIADSAITSVPEPGATAIAAYHKKHAKTFTAPELRQIAAVVLVPADVAATIEVSDADLRRTYDERGAEFLSKERRTVDQILFTDEATAKKAHAALEAGSSFDKVAKEIAKQEAGPLSLGTVEQDGLPLKVLGDAAFKLKAGSFSAPVKSDLGWHILRVTKIEKTKTRPFDQVKAKLKTDIQKERAGDRMVKLTNQIEDELGSGATLEEAAKKYNLKVVKYAAVDRQGNDGDGNKIKGLLTAPEFLSRVFELDEGEDSGMVEARSGASFVARIDKITKPALRPLDKVRDKVVAAIKKDSRRAAATKRAKEILEKLKGGFTLATVAKKEKLTVRTTKPFARDGRAAGADMPGALVTKLFKARRGQALMENGKNGVLLAALKDILEANPSSDTAGSKRLSETLARGIHVDLLAALAGALKDRHSVDIDQDAFKRFFTQNVRN